MKAISDFIKFLNTQERSAATCKSYGYDLHLFIQWFEKVNSEQCRLAAITPTDCRLYKQCLIKERYKPSSINRKLASLHVFLSWAFDQKRIKHKITMPKPVRAQQYAPKWLTRPQVNQLLRTVEQTANIRNIAIVKLLLNTGLRVHELCFLAWQDVQLFSRKGMLTVTGKGRKVRQVPLNKDCRTVLTQLGYAEYKRTDILVFQGQHGLLQPRGVQSMFKRLLGNTRLKHVTPHQLRHTFCKQLVDANVGLEKIAALAGHESLDTTRLYCEPSLHDLQEAVDKIGEEECAA
jgi:integrase/recombinase XerC